jgi:NADH:ubiquinone oxidoreductase subunit 1 (chain H)
MSYLLEVLSIIVKILIVVVPLLIGVAYLTILERKVMGAMQRRVGPNVVGVMGLLQPFADALKLLIKETVFPANANLGIFFIAPILTLSLSIISWAVIPFGESMVVADLNISMLYIFAISSLGVYGIICSGWASNSKYAFLGGLRSAAQMISYEVSIGLIVMAVLLCVGSLNFIQIILNQQYIWFVIPLFPLFLMFFISALAETNRPPFDLPEAEAELVAGYSVEYSAVGFVFFFIGEYANMILMSTLTTILFLGGWWPLLIGAYFDANFLELVWFGLKICLMLFTFVWVRAAFPRYRYDQLMRLGWKIFLPLSLGWLVFIAGALLAFDLMPIS